jgi:hypothetical protein
MKMRKKSEMLEKANQLDDQGWVHRHYMYRLKEEDTEKVEADFGSTSVEKKYGKYEYMTDYELGKLIGGLKALVWALGEEWGEMEIP